MSKHTKKTAQAGFTLVELSIVLVIIGLIVGGVLVGQEMIRSAEMRNFTSTNERFNTAVNTFRSKFQNLPGDVPAAKATSFGLPAIVTAVPNGNGTIDPTTPDIAATAYGDGERQLFWSQMANQGLIPNGPMGTGATAATVGASGAFPLVGPVGAPASGIGILTNAGRNFYYYGITNSAAAAYVATAATAAFTPAKAAEIDTKLDDGAGLTGNVRVFDTPATAVSGTAPTPGVAACLGAAAGNPFNGALTGNLCNLRVAIP